MKLKTFAVTIPITGIAHLEIEAEDEDSAIELAIDKVTLDDVDEWEATKQIVKGNVFYGHTNEAEAEEV